MLDVNCLPKLNLNLRMSFFKKKPKKEIKKLFRELPNISIIEHTSEYPFNLDLNGMLMFVVNKHLVYEYASPIPELGLTSNDLINSKVQDVLPKDYGLFFSNIYSYVLETCKTVRIHSVINGKHWLIICNILKNAGTNQGCLLVRIPYNTVQMIDVAVVSVDV